jgi:hypothetical protein
VLCFCSFSNTSWSSLGRRGGAGPDLKDVVRAVDVLNARRERRRGRRVMRIEVIASGSVYAELSCKYSSCV